MSRKRNDGALAHLRREYAEKVEHAALEVFEEKSLGYGMMRALLQWRRDLSRRCRASTAGVPLAKLATYATSTSNRYAKIWADVPGAVVVTRGKVFTRRAGVA